MGPGAKKSIFVREASVFGESMPLENDLKSNIQVSVVERQSALRMNPIRYGGGGKSKVLLRDIRE
jgi:hypothetical protein